MDTTIETKKVTPLKRSEPRLPRKALLTTLDDRATVDQFLQVRPNTCIVVTTWYNNKEYHGIGFSKVCWPDRWDAEQGADVAKRKALINVLHQVREDEMRAKEVTFAYDPSLVSGVSFLP